MGYHLTTDGQEYLLANDIVSATWDCGLYDDSVDDVPVDGTPADITTEPGSVSTETATVEITQDGDYWVFSNDSTLNFDVSGATATVDSYYLESSGTLIITGALDEDRNLDGTDSLTVDEVGGVFEAP